MYLLLEIVHIEHKKQGVFLHTFSSELGSLLGSQVQMQLLHFMAIPIALLLATGLPSSLA
jgi:hypothetical protein